MTTLGIGIKPVGEAVIAETSSGATVIRVVKKSRHTRTGRWTGKYELSILHLCSVLARATAGVILFCGMTLALPVHLQWDAAPAAEAVTGYNVYRSTTTGTGFAKLTASPIVAPDFTDDPSGPGPFFYVVTSVNVVGESVFSNEVVYRNVPSAPKNLRIAPASVRTWQQIEPQLNRFGQTLVSGGASVDEAQSLAWSGFGAEILVIANANIVKSAAQPFGLKGILDWAMSKSLISVGPGGFYGWQAVVRFQ